MEAQNYVQSLCASSGRRLTPETINRLASLGERREINKAFFAMGVEEIEKEMQGAPTPVPLPDFGALDQVLSSAVKYQLQRRVADLREQEIGLRNSANSEFHLANRHLQDAFKAQIEADALEDKPAPKLSDIIKKVLENPFYQYLSFSDAYKTVTFTTGDVIVRYKNVPQNIDLTVNFGRFKVFWEVSNGRLRLDSHEKNLVIQGYFHPHAYQNNICWGNGQASYQKAMKEWDVATAMNILQAMLQNYNPESPYVRLDVFYALQNKAQLDVEGQTEFRRYGYGWVREDSLEFSVDATSRRDGECYEDDDGQESWTSEAYIAIYRKWNTRFNVEISEQNYYRTKNNRYIALQEEDLVEYD